MRCPFCTFEDTQVKDSRPSEEGAAIRRRRICPECNGRFTTYERAQLRELVVLKRDATKTSFDRDKLTRSILTAMRKRPFTQDQIEEIVTSIVRNLENLGENEIPTTLIGQKVMEVLAKLDQVAYVRFASVYKDFREAKDFGEFLRKMETHYGDPQ
ncbi:MAG: transcriptional regulator NrdR [Alphaproteobacteria bacterium]|jgi:transcriptional repressor NrdR|nr:transcriptional regulator NrdR [Alphaproteobacteria bacterium]MDP3531810.1 transcriptional regulator NrdR [Alphaproteobacteria bacterium]